MSKAYLIIWILNAITVILIVSSLQYIVTLQDTRNLNERQLAEISLQLKMKENKLLEIESQLDMKERETSALKMQIQKQSEGARQEVNFFLKCICFACIFLVYHQYFL